MGREWIRDVRDAGLHTLVDAFKHAFPIHAPDPSDPAHDTITAHRSTWQRFAALANGRAMDGLGWLQRLGALGSPRDFTLLAPDIVVDGVTAHTLDGVCDRFLLWYQRQFLQPAADRDAWKSEHLEYQFACSAGTGDAARTFTAKEYYQGHLDWYNLDLSASDPVLADAPVVRADLLAPSHSVGFAVPPPRRWGEGSARIPAASRLTHPTREAPVIIGPPMNDWFSFPWPNVGQWCRCVA
jgi:hypothetical protein